MAGNWHSPQAGALTRFSESVDFVRETDVVVVRYEVSLVALEAVDAIEPLLCWSSCELRLGSGGGCFLTGGGGAGRFARLESVTEPLTFSGGMLTVFCLTITGRLTGMGGW
jgi:hypothetical protein